MSLQYRFFAIPALWPADAEEELNRFLRSARVTHVHRQFAQRDGDVHWCLMVEYIADGAPVKEPGTPAAGRTRIDYKDLLPPEDFALFAKLRDWRKQAAAAEAVPVYAVFTNEQLARISQQRIATKAALGRIEGVGDARVKKYGDQVLEIVKQANGPEPDETPGRPVSPDHGV